MAEVLDNFIAVLNAIRADIPILIAEVLEENKEAIEQMNREQLDRGERSDGSQLPDYSPVSVSKYGKRPGPMTLEKTGAFKSRITLKTHSNFAELIGLDPKTGMLEARYDLTIIGVNEENLERVKFEILLPGLQNKILAKYFLK